MQTYKKMARHLIWAIFGKNMERIDALPVLKGPLKGRLLPKQPAMDQLSMLFGRYEPAVISEIFRLPETTKVAYDVGAHIGYITLALAHHTDSRSKVFAFEPVPDNVELLKQMTVLNKLEAQVMVLPFALGNSKGEQRFFLWGSSMMHLLVAAVDVQDSSHSQSIAVESSTIDSLVFEQNMPPPQLIKIDVEGAEALVLEGASSLLSTFSPSIIMEIHGPVNAQKVWKILANLNYKWVRLNGLDRLAVLTEANLLSWFSEHSWTNHFLLTKV